MVAQLEARKKEVSRFIVEAGETAEISATRREELRQTFDKLPGFLDELTPTMARLEDLADEQIPLLRDARRAAPDLDAFLTRCSARSPRLRAPPCARWARPPRWARVRSRRARTRSRSCARSRADAPATAKPLRQLLESLDDRRRAIDSDPRGAVNGPPANDPSNRGKTTGFTGLEAIWQVLLLAGPLASTASTTSATSCASAWCSARAPTAARATRTTRPRRIRRWRRSSGSATSTSAPTSRASTRRTSRRAPTPRRWRARRASRAKKVGERRKEGQPDAGPLPGPEGHLQAADHAAAPAPGPDRPPAQAAEDRHRAPRPAARG